MKTSIKVNKPYVVGKLPIRRAISRKISKLRPSVIVGGSFNFVITSNLGGWVEPDYRLTKIMKVMIIHRHEAGG